MRGKTLEPFGVEGKAAAAETRFIFRPVDEEILHSNHKNQVVAIWTTFVSIKKPWILRTHFVSVFYLTVRKTSIIISDIVSVVVCVMESSVVFNTLRTGDADLRFYIKTVQDGWRKSAFLTRACSPCTIHLIMQYIPVRQ